MANPINVLILEHKLVHRVLNIIEKKIKQIERTHKVDEHFIDFLADFFINFVHNYHHVKEEKIFFKDLSKKPLSTEQRKTLIKQVNDHKIAQDELLNIVKSKDRYVSGDYTSYDQVIKTLENFAKMYPNHIVEDETFFAEAINHFSPTEQDQMLELFGEVDKSNVLEKYNERVIEFEKDLGLRS